MSALSMVCLVPPNPDVRRTLLSLRRHRYGQYPTPSEGLPSLKFLVAVLACPNHYLISTEVHRGSQSYNININCPLTGSSLSVDHELPSAL